jgi:hypothetical protein
MAEEAPGRTVPGTAIRPPVGSRARQAQETCPPQAGFTPPPIDSFVHRFINSFEELPRVVFQWLNDSVIQ